MTGLDRFKRDTRKIAKDNGIKIRLLKKDNVMAQGENLSCTGYFSDETMEIVIATNGRDIEWLQVFIHESCHMDQFVENKFLWKKCEPAYDVFSDWINGKKEIPKDILKESIQDIIRLELDCEKRSIQKIKDYKLNIDIPTYIQAVNINLYAYLFFYEVRTWCNDIFELRSVSDLAPKRLRSKYDKIPVKFHEVLLKEYNSHYHNA